jgi:protein disulfide-isomerase A6
MLFTRLIPAAIALLPALAAASAPASAVIDLTPSNFDEVVLKSGKPALVEFFAPWCGHCKTLAPVYEELGNVFQHASSKVSVAKVDADEHKSLGKRFGVSGFPTLKWFDGKSDKPEDYKGGRDLESLSKFIAEKTAIKPKVKGKLPSQVTFLDDKTFKEKVGKDQDVLVAFTAPWCGRMLSRLVVDRSKLLTDSQTARPLPPSGRPSPTTSSTSPTS